MLLYCQSKEGKKVIIDNNLSTHLSSHTIELCEQNNICFVLLPPNSTHLTQPLDIAVFRPVKIEWKKVLKRWKNTKEGRTAPSVPKIVFPRLFKELNDGMNANVGNNLISGFRKAGIYPANRYESVSRLPDRNSNASAAIDDSVLCML